MLYLVKTPWWLSKGIYPAYTWSMPAGQKKLYLSFDDGPHPVATPFVLDTLKKYGVELTYLTKESYEAKKKQLQAQPKDTAGGAMSQGLGDMFSGMFSGMMSSSSWRSSSFWSL